LLKLVSTGVLAFAGASVRWCCRLSVGSEPQPEQDYELNNCRECDGTEMWIFSH
jgi:hypothetical protein